MSTTYYAVLDCCEACGRAEQIEVAHTAAGWRPSFYAYDYLGINSVVDWAALAETGKIAYIENEYGDRESWAHFLERMNEYGTGRADPLRSHSREFSEGHQEGPFDVLDGARYGGRETVRITPTPTPSDQ